MGIGQGSGGGGRRGRRGRRAPLAEINVTPLVDVMLVLLIIFMVTAPLLKAGVPVDLPQARAKALGEDPHELRITLDRAGTVYLDGDRLPAGTLARRLVAMPIAADGKRPPVTLRADRALDYGRVMAVMSVLSRAGFTAIALVTTGGATDGAATDQDAGRDTGRATDRR